MPRVRRLGSASVSENSKEVTDMEWTTPDFEEIETEAEVTAYADHWLDD
jgi:coenzyme PQQ precursor peptide PqqA